MPNETSATKGRDRIGRRIVVRRTTRDLIGHRYNALTAVSRGAPGANGRATWVCLCDCGTTVTVDAHKLRTGHSKSCVCRRSSLNLHRSSVTRPNTTRELAEHYEPEPNTGCWLWLGSQVGDYGQVGSFADETLAHRFFWSRLRGPIPAGLNALHKCDTPMCVNPDHLFLGTIQDNTDDMIAKGRGWWQKRN